MFTFCFLQNATSKIYRLYRIRYTWNLIYIISKLAANINKLIFNLRMFLKLNSFSTDSYCKGVITARSSGKSIPSFSRCSILGTPFLFQPRRS